MTVRRQFDRVRDMLSAGLRDLPGLLQQGCDACVAFVINLPLLIVRLAPALAMIAVVQVAYWGVIKPYLFEFHKPDSLAIENARAAVLDAPTMAAVAKARFVPVELPWSACCDKHYRAVSFDVTLDKVPEQGLGMVSGPLVDNFFTAVNGHIVQGEGRMAAPDGSYHGNIRRVYRLPEAALQPGVNRIDVVMTRNVIPWFDFTSPYIDKRPYPEMMAATAMRSFVLNEYQHIGGTVAAMVALAALVLAARARDRTLLLWMAAMAGFYAAKVLYFTMVESPMPPVVRILYYFTIANLAPAALFGFVDVWTGRGHARLRQVVVLTAIVAVALMVAAFLFLPVIQAICGVFSYDPETAFDFASDLTDALGMVTGLACVLRFLWHLVRVREARILQLALLLFCMTTIVTDRLSEWLWDRVGGDFEQVVPFLIAALALSFLSHNLQLFRSAEDVNAYLSEELRKKEAEIADAFKREAELMRTAALHEERQRLLRDMHDGVGGQLIALLMTARRGPVAPEVLTVQLEQMVDELRLMIDSMDSAGDTLPVALSLFRDRIAPRLEAAGIRFTWSDEAGNAGPAYGPQTLLHVFRIMQEAVTNVFKHSGGKSLGITIAAESDPAHPLRIDIVDDGKGMKDTKGAGHGLLNMRERARQIGALIDFTSGPEGTAVHLRLPAV